jgi:hypothetical protein
MSASDSTIKNPFVGPRALQFGEPLFGRDNEVQDLLDLFIAERIVMLCSPSGAGKSSLIEAGLRQRLIDEGFDVLPTMRVNTPLPPGIELPPSSNRYVFSVLHSLQTKKDPSEQDVKELEELPGLGLKEYLDRQARRSDGPDTKVLIFDQFEEILTVNPTDIEGKRGFFAQLGAALRDRKRWALFSMREEFLAGLDSYLTPVPTRIKVRFRLDLLKEDAAKDAILKTANASANEEENFEFTTEAALQIVNDLRQLRVQGFEGSLEERLGLYVEPVQLQVVCFRILETLPKGQRKIDTDDVDRAGNVDTALGDYYAKRVKETAKETGVSERDIRNWFGDRLITNQGLRGQVLKGKRQSDGLENRAIDMLVEAHLVRAEERLNATWFELAHDRLIEPVQKNNKDWQGNHLSIVQIRASQWEKQKQSKDLLLNYKELIEAERWAFEHDQEMNDVERRYLEAGRNSLNELQRQAIQWETQGRASGLLLQKNWLLEAERWAAAHQSEITDLDLNFLNECRGSLSPLQRQAITWEIHGRKSDHLLRGREMVEAKRWADEHDDQLSYIDREFLSACQANLSQLQQRALLWESQSRSNKLLLDGVELLNANIWTLENIGELTQIEQDFLEASEEAEKTRKREAEQAEKERILTRRIRNYGTIAIITAIIAVLGSSAAVWYFYQTNEKHRAILDVMKINNEQAKDLSNAIKKKESSEQETKRVRENRVIDLSARPTSADIPTEVVEQSLKADEERLKLALPEEDKRRNAIQIIFFPKDIDKEKLEFALRELGYKVVVRDSKGLETNSIWYGSEVCKHMEDVQLVAYTLMRAGVEIKLVEPLKDSKGRENLILVGGNSFERIVNAPSKTVEDIRHLKNCVRQ